MNFISRLLAIFLSIVAFFTGGNYENVKFYVTSEITTQSEFIEIEIDNYSGKTINFTEYFMLEKIDGDTFIQIPYVGSVNDIGISIRNAGIYKKSIKIIEMFGTTLESGSYRLSNELDNGHTISVDFVVLEA